MKYWKLFFNPPKVKHEAIQPTDEPRECDVAATASVEAVPGTDGNAAELDTARTAQGQARATARVFLIRSPRVPLYPLALFFKSRGYRLKQDGRGYVEVVR